ncbi:ABC-2 transporter permease [Psychrobacillus sp. OK032]|uniref:ABC-2 transporter permease n=1 Tax=Psychrobacillus sp. OK032 TaxID=1884358 RepID=UPI0008BB2937|nr:ABC-2 transporter permease [Psychrobacillus sp. OK032]SES44461.1 ABC-2 type transport system permease protein [Psychrobacillus sp. OK032]
MFNLIRRDVILQKRQLLLFIPFIVFFIIMEANPALIFLVASLIIPFNTYVYDEKVETNILLNSLPYTRTEIIASRYLGAIIYMVLAIGVTSLTLFAFNKPFTMTDIAISCSLFLLFAAFTFPLFYIFKPGYIFPIIMISFLLLAGIGPTIMLFLAEHLTPITDFIFNLSVPALYTGATLGIMIVYVISWGITNIIYQRKAF